MARREYLVTFGDCRVRVDIQTERGEVRAFVAQLEMREEDGGWKAIVRYDTAHGFAHRDTMHADGTVTKEPLEMSFAEALTLAQADLMGNRESHVNRYRKEVRR